MNVCDVIWKMEFLQNLKENFYFILLFSCPTLDPHLIINPVYALFSIPISLIYSGLSIFLKMCSLQHLILFPPSFSQVAYGVYVVARSHKYLQLAQLFANSSNGITSPHLFSSAPFSVSALLTYRHT